MKNRNGKDKRGRSGGKRLLRRLVYALACLEVMCGLSRLM